MEHHSRNAGGWAGVTSQRALCDMLRLSGLALKPEGGVRRDNDHAIEDEL